MMISVLKGKLLSGFSGQASLRRIDLIETELLTHLLAARRP